MDYEEPRDIGQMRGITPSVKFLLILNVSIFLLDEVFHAIFGMRMVNGRLVDSRFLSHIFALPAMWWGSLSFGSLFTYMFVHGSFSHILMNMLGIFFIGPIVERTLGSYRFFILYYASGILGGLGWSLMAAQGTSCVGASGALMGVLGAFAAFYPNATLLLWFVIPVKAWLLVAVFAIWELSEMIGKPKIGGIANAAHLMGGIAGCCYALSLKHPNMIDSFLDRLPRFGKSKTGPRPYKQQPKTSNDASLSKEEVDHILDKIGKEGMGALTPKEREMLTKATRG